MPCGHLEVEDDAALPPVVQLEGRVAIGRPGPVGVAVGRFDLHDVRPPVGHDGRRRGPDDEPAQVDHPGALQWARH